MSDPLLEAIPPLWKDVLHEEWDAPYWSKLSTRVMTAYRSSSVFPPFPMVFRALALTAPEDVRVVILGQDPYHTPGVADGLAFSASSSHRIPPSLRNIFLEMTEELGTPVSLHPDLTRLATQGVLLLNTTLTVEEARPHAHAGFGWNYFTDAIIRAVSQHADHVVFLLWGAHAISKLSYIDETKHLILTAPHPSPLSAYRGFFGSGHFRSANLFLTAHGKAPIDWI